MSASRQTITSSDWLVVAGIDALGEPTTRMGTEAENPFALSVIVTVCEPRV